MSDMKQNVTIVSAPQNSAPETSVVPAIAFHSGDDTTSFAISEAFEQQIRTCGYGICCHRDILRVRR